MTRAELEAALEWADIKRVAVENMHDDVQRAHIYHQYPAYKHAPILAAALREAWEEGRRDGLEGVRKIMTYDETATSHGLGQGNTWDVIKRTYTIDADVFDALLAEGKKEGEQS